MSDLDELLLRYGVPTLIYLLCRALGLSQRRAARWAGFSVTTGWRREQEPWWPRLLEAMRARLQRLDPAPARDVEALLRPLLPDAISAYERALDKADKAVARDVLDRVFGKPGTRKPEAGSLDELPPLLIYERTDETPPQDDSPEPPAGAGAVHRQRGGGSDV